MTLSYKQSPTGGVDVQTHTKTHKHEVLLLIIRIIRQNLDWCSIKFAFTGKNEVHLHCISFKTELIFKLLNKVPPTSFQASVAV